MKTHIHFAILCILFVGCSKKENNQIPKSTKIVVVHDVTDSFLLQPLADPVLNLYDFPQNKEQEAAFDFVVLSSRLLNPVKPLHLADDETTEEDNTADDPQYRDKLITKFYDNVRTVFRELPNRFRNQQSENRSMCFCTIVSQVRRLASSRYEKKLLIVYSDLSENNSVFNAYSLEDMKELQEDPEAVGNRISQQCTIPKNLDGITIIFVFQPRTREEDERFMDMVGMYHMVLEKRGAKIKIQAHNDNFQLNDE